METTLRPLRPWDLVWLFGIPTALNAVACKVAIPALDRRGVFPIEVTYFLCVGLLVLVPMFVGALYLTARELGPSRASALFDRMRVRPIHGGDWLWTVGTFVALSMASFVIANIAMPRMGLDAMPFFFQNMPLAPDHRWIRDVFVRAFRSKTLRITASRSQLGP